MNNSSDRYVYENRWKRSSGTADESILAIGWPNTQASFFYEHYNHMILRLLQDRLGLISSNVSVLEIGCGRATASIFLALTTGCRITPTDYSVNAIAIANRNLLSNNLSPTAVQRDLFDIYDSESYDAIISLGVMEHMPDPTNAYKAMLTKLKPGGIMISMNVPEKRFNIQTLFNPLNRILKAFYSFFKLRDPRPWLDTRSRAQTGSVFRTFKTTADFRSACADSGFVNISSYEVNPYPTIDPLPRFLEMLLVRFYQFIHFIVSSLYISSYPFVTSKKLSRCHFIVAEAPCNQI